MKVFVVDIWKQTVARGSFDFALGVYVSQILTKETQELMKATSRLVELLFTARREVCFELTDF